MDLTFSPNIIYFLTDITKISFIKNYVISCLFQKTTEIEAKLFLPANEGFTTNLMPPVL
jgi:hypothetical protein